MTREEAIELIRRYERNSEHYDACEMAIKALEQEPILDKIRAEIIELWKNEPCAIECGCLDEILEIIDKYRGESDCRECKVEHDCYECEKYRGDA